MSVTELVGCVGRLRQNGADGAVFPVPPDEVDFANAGSQSGEERRRDGIGQRSAAAGVRPDRHQHEDDGPLRTLRTPAIDVEKVLEGGLVVGLAERTATKP